MRLASCFLFLSTAWGGEVPLPRVLSFTLAETPGDLSEQFSQKPSVVSQPAFRVLQFHDASAVESHSCDGDFEWAFFYTSGGQLESVTWNSDNGVSVAKLFPAKERRLYSADTAPGMTAMVFVRRLTGDRVLISNVVSPLQIEVRQTVLMRASSVGRFFPWLAVKLQK